MKVMGREKGGLLQEKRWREEVYKRREVEMVVEEEGWGEHCREWD